MFEPLNLQIEINEMSRQNRINSAIGMGACAYIALMHLAAFYAIWYRWPAVVAFFMENGNV